MKKTENDGNMMTVTEYFREFDWRDSPGAGFAFPCDEEGNVTPDNPSSAKNFKDCTDGTNDVIDKGVREFVTHTMLCSCGSGKEPWAEYDGRGIYLCKVCTKCRREKLAGYRPEILAHYTEADVDEPIEPEEY